MKTTILATIFFLFIVGCRYNGNQFVTIQAPAGEKGLAPIGDGIAASGAINVIQSGNTSTQEAGKTLDGIKGAANVPMNGSTASGDPSVTTPPVQ